MVNFFKKWHYWVATVTHLFIFISRDIEFLIEFLASALGSIMIVYFLYAIIYLIKDKIMGKKE